LSPYIFCNPKFWSVSFFQVENQLKKLEKSKKWQKKTPIFVWEPKEAPVIFFFFKCVIWKRETNVVSGTYNIVGIVFIHFIHFYTEHQKDFNQISESSRLTLKSYPNSFSWKTENVIFFFGRSLNLQGGLY
jgi:hypothetical protein